MTDESKASVLSEAQFRAQLETQWGIEFLRKHVEEPLPPSFIDWVTARYVEARQASAWQPIESAPKDGTQILLFERQAIQGSWCKGDAFQTPHWWGTFNPTHWMPLPLAPPVLEDDAHER